MKGNKETNVVDVLVVGSGIMSATLAAMLKRLGPRLSIRVFEATKGLAEESSNAWNNAGTGHAGICELSYTPDINADGSVEVGKAIEIFEQFEQSKQFWAFAVRNGMLGTPSEYITKVPHVSFVEGAKQVAFLRSRHQAMTKHHFFKGMMFSDDPRVISEWAPLLVEDRKDCVVAATKMNGGTDVNFGEIARQLLRWVTIQKDCEVATGHRVIGLQRSQSGWEVTIRHLDTGGCFSVRAGFVFLGAGGGSLRLLQKAGVEESKGIGGFPIGGQWLVCENRDIVGRHKAKVYGQALGAAPTMAVPHLDSRKIAGEHLLVFGPFAKWTTRFLINEGSWTDLFAAVSPDNVGALFRTGAHNLPLIRYLLDQGTQTFDDRMEVLRTFYPSARPEDWRLVDAGIRVQVIKRTDGKAGIVHYGTEVVTSSDGTLASLLGASPGASVSVPIVLDVLKRCFPALIGSPQSTACLKEMIPALEESVTSPANAGRFGDIQRATDLSLGLY